MNVNLTTLVVTINVSSALLVSDGVALLSQTVAAGKVVAATYVDMAATARGPPVIPTTIVAMVGKVVAAMYVDMKVTAMGSLVIPTATAVSLISTVVMELVNMTSAMTLQHSSA